MKGQTFNDHGGYHRIDVVQTTHGWLVTHRVSSFFSSTSGCATSINVHSVHVEDENHAMRITDFKPEDFE